MVDFNLIVAFVALLGLAESGMHHASIKSEYGQLVTSNTLRWTPISNNLRIPSEAVPSGTGNPDRKICRSEHHGALLVGQTTEIGSYCVVGFVNRLHKYVHIIIQRSVSASHVNVYKNLNSDLAYFSIVSKVYTVHQCSRFSEKVLSISQFQA